MRRWAERPANLIFLAKNMLNFAPPYLRCKGAAGTEFVQASK
jgi:hypothetical protein